VGCGRVLEVSVVVLVLFVSGTMVVECGVSVRCLCGFSVLSRCLSDFSIMFFCSVGCVLWFLFCSVLVCMP
jgi:hypothetical protein